MSNLKNFFRPLYVPVMDWHYKKFKAPKRYHHLFDEIKRLKAVSILEVGTWNGNRALQMIEQAKNNNSEVHYIGFDLFEDLSEEIYYHELSKMPPSMPAVEDKLKKSGVQITLIKGNTLQTLPEYVKNAEPVDFVFIDGGHNSDTIKSDWQAVSELMHKDTVVIFDDYWRNRPDQSAKPIVDEIDTTKYEVDILPEIDVFENPDFGHLEISFAKVVLK